MNADVFVGVFNAVQQNSVMQKTIDLYEITTSLGGLHNRPWPVFHLPSQLVFPSEFLLSEENIFKKSFGDLSFYGNATKRCAISRVYIPLMCNRSAIDIRA